MSSETWYRIYQSAWLFDTYLLWLWKKSIFPLQSGECHHSVCQIMTSSTSKQSILIKILVQGETTFHRQQSDGVHGFTDSHETFSISADFDSWGNHQVSIIRHTWFWFSAHLIFDISNVLWNPLPAFSMVLNQKQNFFVDNMSLVELNVNVCLLENDKNATNNWASPRGKVKWNIY